MTLVDIIIVAVIVLALVAISALFSGSETALTAVSRGRMHALEQEGDKRAELVDRLLARPERIVGTVLLGNSLVKILATSLTAGVLIAQFGAIGILYATAIMTVVIVIFGQVLPKTYAIAYPERIALALAPAMRILISVLWPFTAAVQVVTSRILKLTPGTRDDEANILAPHEELRGAIELQQREGAVARGDADMLGGVLDLLDLRVLDIMVHRTKMRTLNAATSADKLIDEVLNGHFTRLPVWEDEPENIIGVLHTKDLLIALGRVNWDASKLEIRQLLSEPWFVPDTTGVKDQLNQFLKRKAHVALVVDEYGEVQGLITLEDILEEIVGQISDEHDLQETAIRPQADGTVNVDGSLPIRDLNRHMGWELPDEEATTIAGLVIHEAQTIPEPGQAFTFYGYRFEILRKTRNRITALRVKPLGAVSKPHPASATSPARAG